MARYLRLLFIFALTSPFGGIIILLYCLEQASGIYNTRFAIVLPLIDLYMFFAFYWMRSHFVKMPPELSEAARIDGVPTWDLLRRIQVPLVMPPDRFTGDQCPFEPGISFFSHWCLLKTPWNAPWLVRLEPSKGIRPLALLCFTEN